MSEENGRPKIKALSRANAFMVSKWLRKHAEEIRGRKLSIEQVAETAGTANNLPPLSTTNLRSICRDFGIEPMWTKGTGGAIRGKSSGTSRYLAYQLLAVAAEIDRIIRALGEKFDPDGTIDLPGLRKIARGELPTSAKESEPDKPNEPSPKIGQVRIVVP